MSHALGVDTSTAVRGEEMRLPPDWFHHAASASRVSSSENEQMVNGAGLAPPAHSVSCCSVWCLPARKVSGFKPPLIVESTSQCRVSDDASRSCLPLVPANHSPAAGTLAIQFARC